LGAFVIISIVRVLVEVAAVAPGQFGEIAMPLIGMLVFCFLIAVALFFPSRKQGAQMPEQKNPAELKPALIFGGIYALVLLAVAVAKQYFGSMGLYVVAVISGLTDLDAITLSTGQLAGSNMIDTLTAWRVILIAVMSNFLFKFGIVAALGSSGLTQRIGCAFAVALAVGGTILLFWPNYAGHGTAIN
jgi:uncharacterized membrane protein (DUF4010 family)